MKLPVEGVPNLYRDSESGAIINTSDTEFNNYIELKKTKLKEKEEIEGLKNKFMEVDELKTDMNEMKEMMKLILSKLDANS